MLNQAQREYIDGLRVSHPGLDLEILRQTLAGASWTEDHIREGLSQYQGVPKQEPEPPTPAPAPAPTLTSPEISDPLIFSQQPAPTPTPTPTPNTAPQPTQTPSATSTAVPQSAQISPQSNIPPQTSSSKSTLWYVAVIGGSVLLVGALSAGAYYVATKTSLFAPKPLTDETLLTTLAQKMGEIRTARYALTTTVGVNDRKAGALPFTPAKKPSEAELAPYQRDQDRMRDIAQIKTSLNEYLYKQTSKKRTYPWSLKEAASKVNDPKGQQYIYTRTVDGTGYSLAVTFETDEAVRAILGDKKYQEHRKTQPSGTTLTLKNTDYFSTGGFTGKPRQLTPFGYNEANSSVEKLIPANMQVKFSLTGILDSTATKELDAQIGITSEATFGDMNFAFEMEAIKKKDTYYAILKKMPAFLNSINHIKGKWIMFTPADIEDSVASNLRVMFDAKKEDDAATAEIYRKQFARLLELAQAERIVIISNKPEQVTEGDQKLTKYQLALAQEKLLPFYEKTVKEFASYGEKSIFPREEEVIAYLSDKDFPTVFKYLKDMLTLSFWVDRKGYPIKAELLVRYIPSGEAEALKNRELDLSFTIALNDINEIITIAPPKDAVPFSDVLTEMTGKSKEQLRVERQEASIRKIRRSLDAYKTVAGKYPNSLDDLLKQRSEVTPDSKKNQVDEAWLNPKFIDSIPLDTYTSKPFTYTTTGKDYTLAYQITLDTYTPEKDPANYYERDYDNYLPAKKNAPKVRLAIRYIHGINTANAKSDSEEARATSLYDTDNDGLPDVLETLFGTDLTKKDTDGDGYTDAEEITSTTNPLGPGKLNIKRGSLY